MFVAHEFHEDIERIIHLKQAKWAGDAPGLALDAAHAVAFHNGLGASLYPTPSTPVHSYLNESSVAAFAEAAYNKPNIVVVADGATQAGLSKWVEPFFKAVPASPSGQLSLNTSASKYYGGEQRVAHIGQNTLVIAFPGTALGANKPETDVLIALLGGESSIKWSPGFSLLSKAAAAAPGAQAHARNIAYSDAGLLAIQITGPASAVRKAAEESVKALKSVVDGPVSKEDLTKAIAKAKFDILSASELSGVGLVATGTNVLHGGKPFQVAEAVKAVESVTAEKLKTVRRISPRIVDRTLTRLSRPPRDF